MSSVDPITLYDSTLRDGSQSEDILFSVADKVRIAHRLDEVGMDFIEGGWPGANPKDGAFFDEMKGHTFNHSRLVAFGSTRHFGSKVEKDPVLQGLLRAETDVITLFGKAWTLHVTQALGIEPAQNLELIFDSIRYLKERVTTVFFDAEHFFDGFKSDSAYAMNVLKTAQEAGADGLILCDTNGGCLVSEVQSMTQSAVALGTVIGIHCHNDSGLAVANTLAAVEVGATHVQGTINGIGERCGNADLIAVVPNLVLKMGRQTEHAKKESISNGCDYLSSLSGFVNEIANRVGQKNQPFVGVSAFAHKGGVHVSAVLKNSETYEHIIPQKVGNQRRILVSEQSGRSNLLAKIAEFGVTDLDARDPRLGQLLEEIKDLEHQGFQFEGAEASFELRARDALGQIPDYFQLQGFRVIDERRLRDDGKRMMGAEATVKLRVGGHLIHLVNEGAGPVDALHAALIRSLEAYYPRIKEMRLVDYKVRILSGDGTAAKVRVLMEWKDSVRTWCCVGVSEHIIAASYDAMVDAVRFKLFSDGVSSV